MITGCRFCWLATGVEITTAARPNFLYCYFGGNTADIGGAGAAQYDIVSIDGVSTLMLDADEAGSNYGFEDPDNGDYNLATGATYRSVALELD